MNYLLIGEEEGRKSEWFQKEKTRVLESHPDAEIHTIYAGEDENKDLSLIFFQPSLFSSFSLIVVRHYENRGGSLTAVISEYLKENHPDSELIIISSERSDFAIPKAVKDGIGRNNTIIFRELTEEGKKDFIIKEFRGSGLKITDRAADGILSATSDNTADLRTAVSSVISFIKISMPDKTEITDEDIEKYSIHSRAEDGGTLFAAFAERNIEKALSIASAIANLDSYSLYRAFSVLTEKFRLLEECLRMRKKGYSFDRISSTVKLPSSAYPGIRVRERKSFIAAMENYTEEDASSVVKFLSEYDADIKSVSSDFLIPLISFISVSVIKHNGII